MYSQRICSSMFASFPHSPYSFALSNFPLSSILLYSLPLCSSLLKLLYSLPTYSTFSHPLLLSFSVHSLPPYSSIFFPFTLSSSKFLSPFPYVPLLPFLFILLPLTISCPLSSSLFLSLSLSFAKLSPSFKSSLA